MKFVGCLLLLVSILAVTGCDTGPRLYEVTGKVSVEGVSVDDGAITFRSPSGALTPQGATITNGQYSLKAQPGSYTVEITGVRVVPGKKGPMGNEDVFETVVPAKYQTGSLLTAEVKAEKNDISFDLKK